MLNQTLGIEKIEELAFYLMQSKQRVVLAGGCFDILHIGHIRFLENAKKQGDKLIILLESDENIKESKGKDRPINPQSDRALVLSAIKSVDYVILLPKMKGNDDYKKLIKIIKPDIIAVTKGDKMLEQKKKQAKAVGAKLIEVNKLIPKQSSSKIIEMIAQSL